MSRKTISKLSLEHLAKKAGESPCRQRAISADAFLYKRILEPTDPYVANKFLARYRWIANIEQSDSLPECSLPQNASIR
jgi:hypothetical protein